MSTESAHRGDSALVLRLMNLFPNGNADSESRTAVTNAATAAASKVTGMSAEKLKEPGVVRELWAGLLDDILGAKKTAKA